MCASLFRCSVTWGHSHSTLGSFLGYITLKIHEIIFFSGGTRDWIQDLVHAEEALYLWMIPTTPWITFITFVKNWKGYICVYFYKEYIFYLIIKMSENCGRFVLYHRSSAGNTFPQTPAPAQFPATTGHWSHFERGLASGREGPAISHIDIYLMAHLVGHGQRLYHSSFSSLWTSSFSRSDS